MASQPPDPAATGEASGGDPGGVSGAPSGAVRRSDGRPPAIIGLPGVKPLARLLATPIRRLGRLRAPAIPDPAGLRPGDAPPIDAELLLIYDGGCGICLHTRDLLAAWDRRGRFAHDTIVRHDAGLLADLDPETRYASWHAIHVDGRAEHGAPALAATLARLPGGAPLAAAMRRFPRVGAAGYAWFVRNRAWISQTAGLVDHPQRDPREQLTHPQHHEVLPQEARDVGR